MLKVIELDGKEFICIGGYISWSTPKKKYLCNLHSKVLSNLYNKFKDVRVIPIFENSKILLKTNPNGYRLYKFRNGILFTIKDTPITGSTEFILNPFDFDLNLLDFGVLPKLYISQALSNRPSVFIKGAVINTKYSKTLVFSASKEMKGNYVSMIKLNNSKVILKKINHNFTLVNQKQGHVRKLWQVGGKLRDGLNVRVPKNLEINKEIWIGINLEDWGSKFKLESLFNDKNEKELALALHDMDFTLFATHSHEFDIGIGRDGNLSSIIEITNFQPYIKKPSQGPSTMFGSIGSIISSKIQTTRIWSIKTHMKSFIIISKNWSSSSWLNKLKKEAENDNCFIIFTDFQGNWASEIAKQIVDYLNK